jgi:hypothetical protein
MLENRGIPHLPIDPALVEWLQAPVVKGPVTPQRHIAVVDFADHLDYRSPAELTRDFAPHA